MGPFDITAGQTCNLSLLHPHLVVLCDLALKLLATIITALGKGNVQWLAADHFVIHFSNRLHPATRSRKSRNLGDALFIQHDLAASDGAKRLEPATRLLVVDIIFQVLDVKIHALIILALAVS